MQVFINSILGKLTGGAFIVGAFTWVNTHFLSNFFSAEQIVQIAAGVAVLIGGGHVLNTAAAGTPVEVAKMLHASTPVAPAPTGGAQG